MAKQLYDYWFIQFDFPNEEGKPYKSSGGKMVWNEKLKREIPDGWDCKTIKELIKVSKETITPSDNPLKLYRHYSIPAFDQFHSYSSELGETIFSDKFIVEPNMLMVSKLNPWTCRTLLSMDYDNQICSTEYVCMKENVKETNGFLFYLTKSEKFISYCTQGATGTSHSHRRVNPDFMINFKFAYNDETIRRFSQHVLYSIKKTNDNIEIIRNLTKQRDELLPLLMNGQVSVNSDLSHD